MSIVAQQAIVERWAAAHGEDITIYTDDGFSGSKDIERPAYDRMLAAIASGIHDTVVVKSIDRLGRRLRGFIDLADQCRIVTVEGGIDTGTPTGRMMLSLLSTFAEFEAAQIGQRQATSQAYRRRSGRALGAPPFGYRNEARADGSWRAIDPVEGPILREVIDGVLAGSSLRSLANNLNDRGILTKQGNKWSAATMAQILDNQTIVGMRPLANGEVFRDENGLPVIDEHLALVTMTEWNRLNEMRAARHVFAPHGHFHDRLLLHGIAVCAKCGGTMTRGSATVGGKIYVNYRCGKDVKTLCGEMPTISQRILDGYVEEQLQPLMGLPVMETVHEADSGAIQQRALIQNEIDALANNMATAAGDEIVTIAGRISDLRAQIDAMPVNTIARTVPTGETFADVWQRDPALVVRQAIHRVYVKTAGRGKTRVPVTERVTIEWAEGWEDYS